MNSPAEQSPEQTAGVVAPVAVAFSPGQLQCGPLRGGLFALIGGLVLWAAYEAVQPLFPAPPATHSTGAMLTAEQTEELTRALAECTRRNAMAVAAALGAILAGVLAAAETLARGQWKALCWRAPLAALVAGLAGAGAGLLGMTVFETLKAQNQFSPLAQTIMTQAAMLGAIGLGTGIGVGLPYKGRCVVNGMVGGVLGGLLVALVYPAAVGFFAPQEQTEQTLPEEGSMRLVWMLAFYLVTALVMSGLGGRPKRVGK